MDEELHGIFLGGIEVRRLDQEALDFVAVGAGEPERFEWQTCRIAERTASFRCVSCPVIADEQIVGRFFFEASQLSLDLASDAMHRTSVVTTGALPIRE